MQKISLFIIVFISIFFWAEASFAAPISYETYQKEAKSYCEDGKPWYTWSRNTQRISYPPFDIGGINTWIATQRAEALNQPPALRESILEKLDPLRIGSLDSSRALEVAQIAYHSRMDTVFDCAVIEARKKIITWLKETVHWQSEILEKIKQEERILNQKANQCIPAWWSQWSNTASAREDPSTRMINTITLQYCHYRQYLIYLESQLEENIAQYNQIDSGIGENPTSNNISHSDLFQTNFLKKQEEIRNEIYAADRAIPRAVSAFKEMERTYATHILLLVIYDDYVKLRDNLGRYMSSTSQLFEKAYNAMSPN